MDTHALDCLDFQRIRELLARYALSALGKSLAGAIRPATRYPLVQRWHNQVRELMLWVEKHGMPPFGGITDVRDLVRRCAPPLELSPEQVAQIGDTLRGTHGVSRYLIGLGEDSPELAHLAERIGDFQTLGERIRAVIDERGEVRDSASPKLARVRREIEQVTQQTRTAVERLLQDPAARRVMQFANYTFHNDRLVLPIRTECKGRIPGIIHRTSDSGATIYVEPAIAVELNNQIAGLRSEEAEEIARLLWELAHEVYINHESIIKTLDALAVLDLLAAKVRFAADYDMRCPEIVEDATLQVRDARHPLLLELQRRKPHDTAHNSDGVVPVSYRLAHDFDMLVITGPNTGGKTVTLKTIGLLTLMVQAGLPVPVGEDSQFGLFTNILIDIGDEQSMQQSLSTFSAHLQRQLEMLNKAGAHTLVLIDELGAGTDPDEGAAIGRTVLDELLRLKCRCVVTTHLGALKGFALDRERAENGCVDFNHETLRPTYHLRIGEPGASNAIAIAQRLGMPKRLVQEARGNLSKRAQALNKALEGTSTAKRQAEQAREAAHHARRDADRAQTEAVDARTRYERRQADFEQWVARVVHLQPGDPVRVRNFDRDGRIVRLRLDQQRAEVDVGSFAVEVPLGDILPPQTPEPPPRPQKPAPPQPKAKRSTPQAKKPRSKDRPRKPQSPQRPERKPLPSLTPDELAALKPGDPVFVKRFHRPARLVRLQVEKSIAIVSMGLMEVEVSFDGLAPANASPRTSDRGTRKSRPPE